MSNKKIKNQDIAYAFLDQKDLRKDILFCSGWDTFFKYEDGYYKMYEPEEFREFVWRFVVGNYPDLGITTSIIKDIVSQIKWASYRKLPTIITDHIAFKDKLYNTKKFKWEEFDRKKIALHQIEFQSDEIHMDTPVFENFIRTTLTDEEDKTDKDLVKLVQEMFGYYLISGLEAQKTFFLVGDGANGKSVMTRVLESIIGREYVSAMTIQTLTTNQFAASNLIGKRVNICNEEESKYLQSSTFKSLITGETMQVERKFEKQFSFTPTTKYLFASNRMPNFEGLNHGLRRRIIIIPFNKIFEEHEQNKNLNEELLNEMPGIINWAMDGAKRLKENNYKFTQTKATDETKMEFEESISSSVMFFRENFTPDDNGFLTNKEIYREYKDWCYENGKKQTASNKFHKDVTKNIKVKKSSRWENNKTDRGYACSRRQDEVPEDMQRLDDALNDDSTTRSIEQTTWTQH